MLGRMDHVGHGRVIDLSPCPTPRDLGLLRLALRHYSCSQYHRGNRAPCDKQADVSDRDRYAHGWQQADQRHYQCRLEDPCK
jgi:hypothetical protein